MTYLLTSDEEGVGLWLDRLARPPCYFSLATGLLFLFFFLISFCFYTEETAINMILHHFITWNFRDTLISRISRVKENREI